MKLERIFITAAVLSAIIAVPVTAALQKITAKYSAEHDNSVHLQLSIDSLKKEATVQKAQAAILKAKNDELNKQLQSRRIVQQAAIASTQQVKPAVIVSGCEQYRSTVSQYQWDIRTAMAVMQAENHGCVANLPSQPNTDGTIDRGLFQVNSIHADLVDGDLTKLYDPTTNIKVAYEIYRGGGWHAWSTYNSGKYLAYLQ